MAESFDMSGALRFDLARGRISLAGGADRGAAQVLIPAEVLGSLWQHMTGAQVKDFGHNIGRTLGARVAARLGSSAPGVQPTEIVEHLGGEFALAGLGSLLLETWGKALVFGIVGSPVSLGSARGMDGAYEPWLTAVLESALVRIFGRELEVVGVPPDGTTARFVVCNRAASTELRDWMATGCAFGELVARLNQSQGAS